MWGICKEINQLTCNADVTNRHVVQILETNMDSYKLQIKGKASFEISTSVKIKGILS